MSLIPKSHPRVKSLLIREKLVNGFDNGLVAKEGLLAQGRGEAFDYILGEKTTRYAMLAIKAAAAQLCLSKMPVISINGNTAALCPEQVIKLSRVIKAKLEVNLFYADKIRRDKIAKTLEKKGAKKIYGMNKHELTKLLGTNSKRKIIDVNGIFAADVVLVPLEDGDRTIALRKAGKIVITFDLNPLSRTSQTANITIVDNIIRAIDLLINQVKIMNTKNHCNLQRIVNKFNNEQNLKYSIIQIRDNLTRRAKIA